MLKEKVFLFLCPRSPRRRLEKWSLRGGSKHLRWGRQKEGSEGPETGGVVERDARDRVSVRRRRGERVESSRRR